MTDQKIVDNSERPAQPEPGEDEATHQPSAREEADAPADVERAKQRERERQTGEA